MDNGVILVLPEIKEYNPRTIFVQNSELINNLNKKHYNNSVSLLRENTYPPNSEFFSPNADSFGNNLMTLADILQKGKNPIDSAHKANRTTNLARHIATHTSQDFMDLYNAHQPGFQYAA